MRFLRALFVQIHVSHMLNIYLLVTLKVELSSELRWVFSVNHSYGCPSFLSSPGNISFGALSVSLNYALSLKLSHHFIIAYPTLASTKLASFPREHFIVPDQIH